MSVYPRKDGVYVYDFWRGGTRFYGSCECTTRREAEQFEKDLKAKVAEQRKKQEAVATGPLTFTAALDKFWLEVGQHYGGSYGKTVFTALEWLGHEFGPETLLGSIATKRISEAIARRRAETVPNRKGDPKPVTNATVNRTVTELLRRIFIRARDVWEEPVRPIQWKTLLLPEPKERTRELRDHEETTLAQNMRNDYLPALAFFVASGCRLNEVVSLSKTDFDWTGRTITIRGKGDKVDIIPLTNEIAAIVTPLWDHHPQAVFTYVSKRVRKHPISKKLIPKGNRFPITYEGMKSTWRRYGGAKAGLIDFRLHDTRHTTATRLLRDSGNLKLVQRLLRHEDITTTVKYAHADIRDLRSAMERLTKSRKKSRKAALVQGGKSTKSKA